MVARPRDCLILSMSRAVSVVSMNGSRSGASAWQERAMVVNAVLPGSGRPGGAGTGSALVIADGEVPQRSGSLAPVPRGSKVTMSKSWRMAGGSRLRATGRISLPLSPGQPAKRAGKFGCRGPGDSEGGRGAVRVSVVDRHGHGAALDGGACAAQRPFDRRCRWERGQVIGGGSGRGRRRRAAGRAPAPGDQGQEEDDRHEGTVAPAADLGRGHGRNG